MNRRQFLTRTSAFGAAALITPRWLHADETSKRINIAVVGALGKGQSDTKGIANEHNVVALVDVDTVRLDKAVTEYLKVVKDKTPDAKAPKTFTDFRKMLDTLDKEIDGVIIATPDHTHFAAATWAIRHKKHICVQKPLCNTIWEARELRRLAKEAGIVSQMGNQGRTGEGQRAVKEWVEQGAIGTLKEIRLWTDRPLWPQGTLPKIAAEVPKTLDWDLWQGQHPATPYWQFDSKKKDKEGKPIIVAAHPFNWRGWWDYGSGALGDMGCHIMDCAFNLLGRRVPEKIDVESEGNTELTGPNWTKLTYHMAPSGNYGPMQITWHDGVKNGKQNKPECDPRIPKEIFDKTSSGMMFVGTEGVVFDATSYCNNPAIYVRAATDKDSEKERKEGIKYNVHDGKFTKTEARSPHPGNPQLEWANAIAKGYTPSSNFDYAVPLTEFVALGNLAIRSGQSISWDTAAMKVTNVEAANKYVKRIGYREGW